MPSARHLGAGARRRTAGDPFPQIVTYSEPGAFGPPALSGTNPVVASDPPQGLSRFCY